MSEIEVSLERHSKGTNASVRVVGSDGAECLATSKELLSEALKAAREIDEQYPPQ